MMILQKNGTLRIFYAELDTLTLVDNSINSRNEFIFDGHYK